MVLEINNKKIIAKYNKVGELLIKLDNDTDKLYFKEWYYKSLNSYSKVDYIMDIEYNILNESGILKHCFPVLNINMDEVKLVYDRIIINK